MKLFCLFVNNQQSILYLHIQLQITIETLNILSFPLRLIYIDANTISGKFNERYKKLPINELYSGFTFNNLML